MKSDVVIGLLQGACRFEPDPTIREWAQGLLIEQGFTPRASEWTTIGCDGKVYSRAEMVAVRGLSVVDAVDRNSFLQKPNGHIKVWLSYWVIPKKFRLFSLVITAVFSVLLGYFFSSLSTSDQRLLFIATFFWALVLLYGSSWLFCAWTSRKLEWTGKLYLGQLKTVKEGWRGRVHCYVFAFVFKTSSGELIEAARVVYGKRPDLEFSVNWPMGRPMPVLYAENGYRLV